MLSVVLPIIGILGLWMASGQNVNAVTATEVNVGSATLNSTNNYTADGTTAIPDPGDGHRATGYALFDANSGTLTLNRFSTSNISYQGDYYSRLWAVYDLNLVLVGNNVLASNNSACSDDCYVLSVDGNLTITGSGSLTIENQPISTGYYNIGIYVDEFVIDSGIVNVNGLLSGLSISNYMSISSGTLDATGGEGAIAVSNSITLNNKVSIRIPQGGTIELHNFGEGNAYTVMDGNTVALHAIISDHDENNGSGDGSGNSAGGAGKACNHDYQWTVEREPTITEDGEEVYKCTKCGDISARQPLSAAGFCFLDAEGKVRNAKAGQTLKLNFKQWNSVPKAFFEELAKRRDITVVIRFTYNHKTYEMTVTPDMAIDISHDYYGPEKLILLYGAKEVKG